MKTIANLIKITSRKVSRANPLHVAAICVAIGSIIVLAGSIQELLHMRALMDLYGSAGCDAYTANVYANRAATLSDYLFKSIGGDLPEVSAPIKGVGMWIVLVGSPAAACVTLVAKIIRLAIFHARTARAA